MVKKTNAAELVGQFILVTAVALFVAAQATNYFWVQGSANAGLWYTCSSSSCVFVDWVFYTISTTTTTVAFSTDSLALMVSRIIDLVADLFGVIALICMLVSFMVKFRGAAVIGEGVNFLIAGIFAIGGMSTYTSWVSNGFTGSYTYGYSFYLGWVGAGLFFIGGILLIVAGSSLKNSAVEPVAQHQVTVINTDYTGTQLYNPPPGAQYVPPPPAGTQGSYY